MAAKKPLQRLRHNCSSDSSKKRVCQECGRSFAHEFRLRGHKEKSHGVYNANEQIPLEIPPGFGNGSIERRNTSPVTPNQQTNPQLPSLRPLIEAYSHDSNNLDRVHGNYELRGTMSGSELPTDTPMGHHSITYTNTYSSGSFHGRKPQTYQQQSIMSNNEPTRGTAMRHNSIAYSYTHSSDTPHRGGQSFTPSQYEEINTRDTNLMEFGEEDIYGV